MSGPSERVVKRLFALSRNQCAFSNCTMAIVQPDSGTVTGKICHIKAKSSDGPRYDPKQSEEERHGFENLILLCGIHHDIIDDQPKEYSVEKLKQMKAAHEQNSFGLIEISKTEAALAYALYNSYQHIEAHDESQVMVNSPGAVQARNVTIKTNSKKPPTIQPTDAIGANIELRAYTEYLIKRYIEWRKKGVGQKKDKRPFHPSMIHQLIERTFGARTYLVSQKRFQELVEFLQSAIDNTIIGKLNTYRNYHSYAEHLDLLSKKKSKTKSERTIVP